MHRIADFFAAIEAKLDEWGKGAWIATMVLFFILAWPIGLVILGYMIWSGRMSCSRKSWRIRNRNGQTGNTAFDDYREETLRRLEDEQSAFEAFLGNLRRAKDKAEFDQFMTERRSTGPAPEPVG